jgi:hypothetical protein
VALDPLGDALVDCMGGIGCNITVKPQGTSVISVNPREYVRLDRPGHWTLRMFHDLGMGRPRGDDDPRWTTASIDLVMPTDAQARSVLAEHERLMADAIARRASRPDNVMGERSALLPEFSAMAFPVFLAPLVESAHAGSRFAITGIASIATTEACDALLDLLEKAPVPPLDRETAFNSAMGHPWGLVLTTLGERLPPPFGERKWLGSGDSRLLATMDGSRIKRAERTALTLVAFPDPGVRQAALAFLARCPLEDGALLGLLDRVLRGTRDDAGFEHLLASCRSNVSVLPDPGQGPAAALVWLDHLQRHAEVRPPGWKEVLTSLVAHPSHRVREWAATIIPREEAGRWEPLVGVLLHDADENVRQRAIHAAEGLPGTGLLPALTDAMVHDLSPDRAARVIFRKAGRGEEAMAWITYVERSSDRLAISNGISGLFRALGVPGVRSPGTLAYLPDADTRQRIVKHLRDFVVARRVAIDQSPLGPPDRSWPVDLLPSGWAIEMPDHTSWPPEGP